MTETLTDLREGLNTDQLAAFEKLVDFIKPGGNSVFVLKGYAGTGKTFLIKRLIQHIRKSTSAKIALTAPTNKAVRVMKKSAEITGRNIVYQTIHSLLGLKEKIKPDGTITYTRDTMEKNNLEKQKYLIIDEVSMLSDELFTEIYKSRFDVKIILMGDPAQIPPVGKENCIVFSESAQSKFNFEVAELKQIQRQKSDNPIVKATLAIRDNIRSENLPEVETETDDQGHGIFVFESADGLEFRRLIDEHFADPKFLENPDYAKIIAWTNNTVKTYNRIVREKLFGRDVPKLVIGDRLIANKPILDDDMIIMTTSEEMEVVEVHKEQQMLMTAKKQHLFSIYECRVRYFPNDMESYAYVNILHEESYNDYMFFADELKNIAIKNAGAYGSWKRYYDFIRNFADINYNYAITAHKSQGSTYQNVFILEKDIDMNQVTWERNRIKYTAYSRPTNKLFILR